MKEVDYMTFYDTLYLILCNIFILLLLLLYTVYTSHLCLNMIYSIQHFSIIICITNFNIIKEWQEQDLLYHYEIYVLCLTM